MLLLLMMTMIMMMRAVSARVVCSETRCGRWTCRDAGLPSRLFAVDRLARPALSTTASFLQHSSNDTTLLKRAYRIVFAATRYRHNVTALTACAVSQGVSLVGR